MRLGVEGLRPRNLLVAGVAAGSLLVAGCGGSGNKSAASEASPVKKSGEACHFDKASNTSQLGDSVVSPNKSFCLEAVYPMGQSEVINGTDNGEIGFVGLKIKFDGLEYNCILPTTQPDQGGKPLIRGEVFSLRQSCIKITP